MTAGSLTSAYYQQSFGYDALDRLTSGPAGSYTYTVGTCRVSSWSQYYQPSYDASGNMRCRATAHGESRPGAHRPTDDLRQRGPDDALAGQADGPTHQQDMAYDGEGDRVAFKVDGTITYYLGQYSEITGSTHTKYLQPGNGLPTVMSVGTGPAMPSNILLADGLGSITAIFDDAGMCSRRSSMPPMGRCVIPAAVRV